MGILVRFGAFVGDLVLLNLAILLSYSFFGMDILGPERFNAIYLFIFSNMTWLFLVVVSNPYNVSGNWGLQKIVKSQLSFVFIHLLVVASMIILLRKSYQPYQILVMYALFVPSFFVVKFLTFYGSSLLVNRKRNRVNYIIVGEPDLAREVRRYFLEHPELPYRFFGVFDHHMKDESLEGLRVFCERNSIHEVFCCLPEMSTTDVKRVVDFGMDALIDVKLISDYRSIRQRALALEHYDQIPLFDVSTIPLDNNINLLLKRVFDVTFSLLVAMLILSWLIPVVGILIKLESPGPVFFRQLRSGKKNRSFFCVKFRTMVVNNEADSKQATMNDPRITRMGSILRRTSLDEFPQFLNVILGDMSIVGPRPHPIKLNERFRPLITKYMIRHYVKPGVTGLAQVMGYRGETKQIRDMRNRIRLDRFYIENWSFYFDVKIVVMTAVSVITGDEKAF